MPKITEVPPKKPTCIYVVNGLEVLRREEDQHPGMDVVTVKWSGEERVPNSMPPRIRGTSHKGEFYWDHMDARSNHVFVCHNPLETLITCEESNNVAPVLQPAV